jgi:hypothetical protein
VTGDIGTYWKVDVLFNSTMSEVAENDTNDSIISVNYCTEDFSLSWSSISFGHVNPMSEHNSAPGNPTNNYNITINLGSCDLDFYMRGTDMVNETSNDILGVGNVSWSNASNDYSSSFNLTKANEVIRLNVSQNNNITTWYWINIPSVYAGYYNGTITITGVKNGEAP